jgi:hypothetical protein
MAISNTDQLKIYNGALRLLGSRRLGALTESREPRRVLDDIWDNGGIVKSALERGEWNFALRAVQGAYDPGVTPSFGFRFAFAKPDDFRRLAGLSASEYFRPPLTDSQYVDEGGYWLAEHEVIYIRYVSSGQSYGFDSSRWTEAFTEYLEARMAHEGCERITNSDSKKQLLERQMDKSLRTAKSVDSMQEGVKFFPRGSWVSSRGRSIGGRDQ